MQKPPFWKLIIVWNYRWDHECSSIMSASMWMVMMTFLSLLIWMAMIGKIITWSIFLSNLLKRTTPLQRTIKTVGPKHALSEGVHCKWKPRARSFWSDETSYSQEGNISLIVFFFWCWLEAQQVTLLARACFITPMLMREWWPSCNITGASSASLLKTVF